MNGEARALEGLDTHVRTMTAATSPSDVFRTLLDGARTAVPRASVYLVRQDQIRGWGAVGFPAEASQRLRRHAAPVTAGWLGRIAESKEALREPQAGGLCPDFGQPGPTECFGMPVRVKQRPIALLVAERTGDESPWLPAALAVLVRVAEMRLELDLLRRRVARGEPEESGAPAATASAAAGAVTQVEPEAAGAERAADAGDLDAARRYARLVATDIRLYNEDAVALGRRNGDLAERLREHLVRGKETFLRRHGELGPPALEILREAYVQVLAGGDSSLVPAATLD